MRREERASFSESPRAKSTCDGFMARVEQAEPEETAIPSWSKATIRPSASTPGKQKFTLLGRRFSAEPFSFVPGTIFKMPSISLSRKVFSFEMRF